MSAAASRYLRENFDDWNLSPKAAQLADAVGHYINGEGFTWLSDETLARRMGRITPRTVQRARQEVRSKGVYVITPGDGRGRATMYALPETVLKVVTGVDLSDAKGRHQSRERSTNRTRKVDTRVDPRSLVVDPCRTRVPWCDETCRLCAGVGWIEILDADGINPTNVAAPCPNRQS